VHIELCVDQWPKANSADAKSRAAE